MASGRTLAAPGIFTALFNKCLSEGCFPNSWKVGNLVTFLKSPTRDCRDPGSFRPITLLSVLGKVLERVLVTRLRDLVVHMPSQFGFTVGRSTIDAWTKAQAIVEGCTARYVVGIFVDFKGAFDHLNWGAIIHKLRQLNCAETAIWQSYFRERRTCMIGRRDVIWRNVERGCPQGSISGPMFWNMLMDQLLETLEQDGIQHVAYADDLLIILEGRNRRILERSSRSALQHAIAWGARVGVEVSFQKTEALMLRGAFNLQRRPIILIDDHRVKFQAQVKYLGIWTAAGLRFERHLREMKEKLLGTILPLRRVLKRDWGLKRKATLAWLNGLLMPIAMYVMVHQFGTAQYRHRTDGHW